jgi:hypothetical protein
LAEELAQLRWGTYRGHSAVSDPAPQDLLFDGPYTLAECRLGLRKDYITCDKCGIKSGPLTFKPICLKNRLLALDRSVAFYVA